MKTACCFVLLLGVVAFVAGDNPTQKAPQQPTADAELKWAKGVVKDFFDAFFMFNGQKNWSDLLTPVMRENWPGELNAFESATLTTAMMDPSRTEVIVSGVLKLQPEAKSREPYDVTVRVVREGGAWIIRYLRQELGEKP